MDGSIYSGSDRRSYRASWYGGEPGSGLTARLANTPNTLLEACRLRYDAYRAVGFIDSKPNSVFIDEYDSYSTSKTAVIYKDEMPAATVRVCLHDPATAVPGVHTMPAMGFFEREIDAYMGEIRVADRAPRGVEITRMARHPDFSKNNEVILAVMSMIGYLVLHFDADVVFTAICDHHIPFYRRMGLHKLTEPRQNPKLKTTATLMAFFRRHHTSVQQRTSLLDAVSVDDDIYDDLFSGHLVPLFGSDQNSGMLDCMFNRHHADVTVPAVVANAAMMSSRASHGQRLAA